MRMPFTDSRVFHLYTRLLNCNLYHSVYCLYFPPSSSLLVTSTQNKEAGNAPFNFRPTNPTLYLRVASVVHNGGEHSTRETHPTLLQAAPPPAHPHPPSLLTRSPLPSPPSSPTTAIQPARHHRASSAVLPCHPLTCIRRHPAATGYMRPLNHHHHSAR